jgi:hypothetical protein
MKRTKRLVKQPLQLSRDTIRNLEVADLRHAAGGSAIIRTGPVLSCTSACDTTTVSWG